MAEEHEQDSPDLEHDEERLEHDEVALEHDEEALEDHASGGRSERLHTIIALSIAVISVVGAVISWRVEVHASAATDLDENAVQASISRSGLQNDAQQQAYAAAASYNRYIQVQDEAQQLTGQSCDSNSDTSTILGADALADCILTTPLSQYDVPAYISQSDPRQYDVQSFAADVEAVNRYEKNVDSAAYQSQAADERHGEYRMLWLSLLLVAALALCTVAQLERRRGWSLRLVIPGWVLLAATVALLIGWEH